MKKEAALLLLLVQFIQHSFSPLPQPGWDEEKEKEEAPSVTPPKRVTHNTSLSLSLSLFHWSSYRQKAASIAQAINNEGHSQPTAPPFASKGRKREEEEESKLQNKKQKELNCEGEQKKPFSELAVGGRDQDWEGQSYVTEKLLLSNPFKWKGSTTYPVLPLLPTRMLSPTVSQKRLFPLVRFPLERARLQ